MMANTIIIDNIEYYIISKIPFNNNIYYILANCSNSQDILVKKEITENNETYFVNLDSKKEFKELFEYYNKKTSN